MILPFHWWVPERWEHLLVDGILKLRQATSDPAPGRTISGRPYSTPFSLRFINTYHSVDIIYFVFLSEKENTQSISSKKFFFTFWKKPMGWKLFVTDRFWYFSFQDQAHNTSYTCILANWMTLSLLFDVLVCMTGM